MDANEADFLKRLNSIFQTEAEEHTRSISVGLVELEKETDRERQAKLVEEIFRETHSLKGAARSADQKDIEAICQPLESIFFAVKSRSIDTTPALFDLLHVTVDSITHFVSLSGAAFSSADRERVNDLIRRLEAAAAGEVSVPAPEAVSIAHPPGEKESVSTGTVRIATEKLNELLLQTEEMFQIKMIAGQRSTEINEINRMLSSWKAESAKRADFNFAAHLSDAVFRVAALKRAMEQDHRVIKKMVDDHLEAMKMIVMLPVSSLIEPFPKMVRDLAREQGKETELSVNGAEIEMDKRILDELKGPLIHLLRNCVDHGIAKPEARTGRGKPPSGKISVSFAAKNGRHMEITVSDDGEGIDTDRVKEAAVKMGIVARETAAEFGPDEAADLIFQSGVSTSPIVTDISGRGLGLAIVREKIEKLSGEVTVRSEAGSGTTFKLLVPLTVATFRGVLVKAGDGIFVLPTMNVERSLRANRDQVKTVENRETISVAGKIVSMVRLNDMLGVRKAAETSDRFPVVVLAFAGKRLAVQVDQVLDERQVIFKSLGPQLSRVRNISGATILGDGKVVPVLNISDLMKSAIRPIAKPELPAIPVGAPKRTGRILVAEDSITARSLIKNILESAGYMVATAVDGMDALTQAREGDFDAVVSDVDMPRMNGFDLTAGIRGDSRLKETPVILITALASRADRERGIEVGANAYIVKSSFDQSDLLETVRRFI
ncbi:MAG: response regulator [Treponemataceae bacterium]